MCGLTGFVAPGPVPTDDLIRTVRPMCAAIAHRGPDGQGEWVEADSGVALGFRRLAILDLSPAGDQPMTSASGRYVATFNGEIYNFQELRETLEDKGAAPRFRGRSDTEVMLAAFDAWGVTTSTVRQFNGMFAVAVWDRHLRRLHLIRDRMGVKPLYYGLAGRTFLYGSELKAIAQHPDFKPSINRGGIHLYLRFLSMPEPHCIYDGFTKVRPGTILSLDLETRSTETSVYWSVFDAVARGSARRFHGSEEDAAIELERLARDAVRLRMIADVPVGVFLSGGVDSSVIAALMQVQSALPVRSFSVGFSDARYDESRFARPVAAHLGTDHTEVIMTPQDVMNTIPKLPAMYDEPFGDSSQIPTHLVSTIARRAVTVSLSGDGGDELFGGYVRYFIGQAILRRMAGVPRWIQPAVGRGLALLPPHVWDRALSLGRWWLPPAIRRVKPGQRVHQIARAFANGDPDRLYFELVSHWRELVNEAVLPDTATGEWAVPPSLTDPVERMMFLDQITYLPSDILTKVDRATMAVSLEAREPLLDYRLIEFAWTLPLSMKVRDRKGKPLLRRVLRNHVPDALIERPKMGFGMPVGDWLRGPLREWAESLLDPADMRSAGLIDPGPVRAKWDDHISGRGEWTQELWAVLMLQAWIQAHRPASRAAA
jgi:asparagine synthase (glutamine-hydrolysing)